MSPEQARIIIKNSWPNMATRGDNILRGLNILTIYDQELEQDTHSGQIYAGDFESLVESMSDKDIERMGELGWFEDEDSWSHNV